MWLVVTQLRLAPFILCLVAEWLGDHGDVMDL